MNNPFDPTGLVLDIEVVGLESLNYSNYLCFCAIVCVMIDSCSCDFLLFLISTIFPI